MKICISNQKWGSRAAVTETVLTLHHFKEIKTRYVLPVTVSAYSCQAKETIYVVDLENFLTKCIGSSLKMICGYFVYVYKKDVWRAEFFLTCSSTQNVQF